MRRPLAALAVWIATLALVAPAALANDHGQGLYGETDDKVVTNAGFILIAFFPPWCWCSASSRGGWTSARRRASPAQKARARAPIATAGRTPASSPLLHTRRAPALAPCLTNETLLVPLRGPGSPPGPRCL